MPSDAPRLARKDGLYLADAGAKGRGVFCDRPIRRGETLEVTPALLLNEDATAHVDNTVLVDYTFATGALSAGLRKKAGVRRSSDVSCVVYGVLTFCNHDEANNAEIQWEEHDGTLYYHLVATRDIKPHTEICTTYGDDWFAERAIAPATRGRGKKSRK